MIKEYNEFINEKNENIISLYYVNNIIKDVFSNTKVSSVDTIYEKDGDNNKLVLTLNNLFFNKTNILHTKFIFYTDKKKRQLVHDYFHYQYDINCNYKKVSFNTINELQKNIEDIINNKKFGKDIINLSNLSVTMSTDVNKLLKDNDISNLSIYNISYNPIVDQVPCESLSFHFEINIDDTRFIKMVLKKIDNKNYKISFNENDWFDEYNIDNIKSIPQIIVNMIKKYLI